ncbi:MAG: hypothetical protein HND47_23155 [Chloroflexi bacterium]|nr:hypothetical protein [Chloroflexota bacterium]
MNRLKISLPVYFSKRFAYQIYTAMLSDSVGKPSSEFVSLADGDVPYQKTPVKLIAFYLPQFHPIPENDEWWGKGFTEWTNVTKAVPQFVGHYQPHMPGELGYYDLRVPDVQARQIELAQKYGISGFAFHYYWFNGKRLLDKPLEMFMESKNNFSFCLCWANENWTRRWDGQEDDVLIAQVHTPESDLQFIQDISLYFRDERYIRVKGRPLLIVYRPNIIPDINNTVNLWRKYCKDHGLGDPYLVAAQTFWFADPREVGFDAAVEFPPHNMPVTDIRHMMRFANRSYQGHVIDYKEVMQYSMLKERPDYQLFRTVFPGWDNEARKPGRGYSFVFSSPGLYKKWLLNLMKYTLRNVDDPEKRIVFINAWNEWAEGAHLEPDRKYGYAYLQATADALRELDEVGSISCQPIIIFQPGKVGSTSIHTSLERNYQRSGLFVPIYHAHILENIDQQIEFVSRVRTSASNTVKKLLKGKDLRRQIDEHPEISWNVISLVRDPVAQKVSALFQLIDEYIPDWRQRTSSDLIMNMQKILVGQEEFEPERLDSWFDKQIKPIWGIDVLAIPFSSEKGYHIYRDKNLNLIIIRLEDLNRVAKRAFQEFLGFREFEIISTNVGAEKPYHSLYEQFKKIPIPVSYLEKAYSTKYVQHFYTDDEIAKFRSRWAGN